MKVTKQHWITGFILLLALGAGTFLGISVYKSKKMEEAKKQYCSVLDDLPPPPETFYTDQLQVEMSKMVRNGHYQAAKRSKWVYGYIDKSGKVVIQPQFTEAEAFSQGLAVVHRPNGEVGYVDKTGQMVIGPGPYEARKFSYGLAPIQAVKNGPWGYINFRGIFTIQPSYSNASVFSEGLARVEKNGLWGYINPKGETIISHQYDWAGDFDHGYAKVRKGSQWFYIDPAGQPLKQGKNYVEPGTSKTKDKRPSKKDGWIAIKAEDKYGYIDQNGKVVITPQYEWAGHFSEGFGVVGYLCTPGKGD